jgi:hypothetical protein
VLLDPLTVALNVVDWPPAREAVAGDTETETGTSDILELALFVGSAALAAVTVTVCAELMVEGALYKPFVSVPTLGDIDQFTPVLVDPVTVAARVVDCPPISEAVAGVREMETEAGGVKEMVELSLLVPSATLVAFMVIVWAEVTDAGAL